MKKRYDSISQHPGDHFKLFRSILALELTKLQAFEISNIFVSSSFGNINRLHVSDGMDYNDKSGEIKPFIVIANLFKQSLVSLFCLGDKVPFKILKIIRLLSFKCLRKLYRLFCLYRLVRLVCLVHLFRPACLVSSCLALKKFFCLTLRKFYHLTCRLAAPPYHFGVRTIKHEVRLLIACAEYARELRAIKWENKNVCELVRVGLEVVSVLSRRLVRVIGVGAWVLCEVLVIINTFISSSSAPMSVTSIVSKPSIIYQLNIICQVKLKISELLFKPIISSRSIWIK